MKLDGEKRIAAPRDAVWRALNDPDVLRTAITGCEELVKQSDTQYAAKVVAKVGPVKAKFSGEVLLSELNAPASYVITGKGKGGAAGFASGRAWVRLDEEGAATVLCYTAEAQVGGKLAQLGSRLLHSTANKMADEFFTKFAEHFDGNATEG